VNSNCVLKVSIAARRVARDSNRVCNVRKLNSVSRVLSFLRIDRHVARIRAECRMTQDLDVLAFGTQIGKCLLDILVTVLSQFFELNTRFKLPTPINISQ